MADERGERKGSPQGSGLPGDGKGRRDEVGGSGVYPASGPLPQNPDATYHDQASWGQGDRGAEGYEDSGRSEIHPESGSAEPVGSGDQGQAESEDPNRQPGDEDLYNRDKQGNIFYDKNTEERRETQFHDATAAPVNDEPKVTRENDQFGKQDEGGGR